MHHQRLAVLRDGLLVTRANFDIRFIVLTDIAPETLDIDKMKDALHYPGCGTTACACGLFPEIFEEFEYKLEDGFVTVGLKNLKDYKGNDNCIRTMAYLHSMSFLDLTEPEWEYLFEKFSYPLNQYNDPKAVASHIQDLLNGVEINEETLQEHQDNIENSQGVY